MRLFLLPGLLLGLFFASGVAHAASEAKACAPDGSDTNAVYGDSFAGTNCVLTPAGDQDLIKFVGTKDDRIRVVALDTSGSGFVGVCVEVRDPGGALVGGTAFCGDVALQQDLQLTLTGIHTIVISESGNDSAMSYQIFVERLAPQRAEWPQITYGQTLSDTIDPAVDQDAYRFAGKAGTLVRLSVVDLSGSGFVGICVDVRTPTGTAADAELCADVGAQRDITLPVDGTYTIIVREAGDDSATSYNLSLTCINGACPVPLPVCKADPTFASGTLTLNFTLRTPSPVVWNTWLSLGARVIPLWTGVSLPAIDPPFQAPLPVPGFPSVGTIGFLSTFATAQAGIVCSEWRTVDTGPLPTGTTLPSDEEIRRRLQPMRPQ